MPRPNADPHQKLRAFEIFKLIGAKPALIRKVIVDEFTEAEAVSPRTISNWIWQFKNLKLGPDEPFDWSKMEDYGLPWEGSEFILNMWAYFKSGWKPTIRVREQTYGYDPTVREVRWWWRVHQALPEIEDMDVFLIAAAYLRTDLESGLLGKEPQFAGLNALIAFRPWESDAKAAVYDESIAAGLIPRPPVQYAASVKGLPIRDNDPELNASITLARITAMLWPNPLNLHLLPSQVISSLNVQKGTPLSDIDE